MSSASNRLYKTIVEVMRECGPEILNKNQWLQFDDITQEEMEQFPAAKEAAEIQKTALYRALK